MSPKSQVQPFVTREASIPDLQIVKKTYAKLREVTITYNVPDKLLGKNPVFTQCHYFAGGQKPVILLSGEI